SKWTDYVFSSEWNKKQDNTKKNIRNNTLIHNRLPQWLPETLPKTTTLSAMPLIHYFLLCNQAGQAKEIFSNISESIPHELLNFSSLVKKLRSHESHDQHISESIPYEWLHSRSLVQKLSHDQPLLIKLGHKPFVITSDMILDKNGLVIGYLMLASRLNNDFISVAVQEMNPKHLIALIDNHTGRVIADNSQNGRLTGIQEDKLRMKYHVLGKTFFDYGISDLHAHFISLIPKKSYHKMGREILIADRWNRAITGAVILVCLCVILVTVTHRISKVTARIDEFAEKEMHTSILASRTGDQLFILEKRFMVLGQQVIEGRNNLREQVAKRTREYQITNSLLEKEIIERIKAEKQQQEILAEKDALLKEIHHRVKNNMQIAASLIFLQAQSVENPEAQRVLQDTQERIRSMGLVHELLYRSGNFSKVIFSEYIESLVQSLQGSYYENNLRNISLLVEAEGIALPVDTAVPCGLIINELVTNCFKYAFTGPSAPTDNATITIKFIREYHLYKLTVHDNGIGLPADYDWKSAQSLGLNLVHTLAGQLDAEVWFESDNGLKTSLLFSTSDYSIKKES
ncbi:hypothetical protein VU04_02415, partial [Desulfobulbus sp. TB]|nr:hypothetical protein [Desulfobulbus sp. TB]